MTSDTTHTIHTQLKQGHWGTATFRIVPSKRQTPVCGFLICTQLQDHSGSGNNTEVYITDRKNKESVCSLILGSILSV